MRTGDPGASGIEILVGAHVVDPAGYARYRAEMTPLLEAARGSFGVDAVVGEMLRPIEAQWVNRLFTIRFPALDAMHGFFSLPEYRAIRTREFDPSVARVRRLGRYQLLDSG